jgi:hypothetical protein
MKKATLAGLGLTLALPLSIHTNLLQHLPLSTRPILLQHYLENGDAPGAYSDIMIAANETKPEESAKMGKEQGTHSGANQGATSESNSAKIDQPGAEHPKQ